MTTKMTEKNSDGQATYDDTVALTHADKTIENIQSDVLKYAQERDDILDSYLNEGESVDGYGYGGSESVTLFLKSQSGDSMVRKILSERLLTTKWKRNGENVMLHPCPKAKNQTRYLLDLPCSVKRLFPEVLDVNERHNRYADDESKTYYEFIYDMTYVPGIEVSKFIRDYQPNSKLVAILYTEIFRYLRNRLHSQRRRIPVRPTLEQSYFSKIEKRLELCQSTAPNTFSDDLLKSEFILMNGTYKRNVSRIIREFRENPLYLRILEPKFHSLVVGDTNTENIKIGNIEPLLKRYKNLSFKNPPFTAEDLQIRFLDPRAIGFYENGRDTSTDDPMYDNKPWHNSLGNYDRIHGEYFDLEFEVNQALPILDIDFHSQSPYTKSYADIEKYFSESMTAAWKLDDPESDVNRNDPYWLFRFVFLMGTHFMAMPPYHFSKTEEGILHDNATDQKRPLAVYAEGIKWLNLALDMLEGKIRVFCGIPVPHIYNSKALVKTCSDESNSKDVQAA